MSEEKKRPFDIRGLNQKRESIRNGFSDPSTRQLMKLWIVVIAVLIAAVVWGGGRFVPAFDVIINLSNLYDSIFILFVLTTIVNAFSEQGEFDEYRSNEELQQEFNLYQKKSSEIDDYTLFSKKVYRYNQYRYKEASSQRRAHLIEGYKYALAGATAKGKLSKISFWRDKIAALEEKDENGNYVKPVRPKKFKRYKWESFISPKNEKTETDVDIDYSSKSKVRWGLRKKSIIKTALAVLFRAGLAVAFNEPFGSILLFILIVAVLSAINALIAYERTRIDVDLYEKAAIKWKRRELTKIMEWPLEKKEG